ncbi:hypothetical protein RHGRI_017811 [Rhododendron griersonianum]|uniref:Uncharacterized protein n=1 Tax=Rhododendron griersonianum TaxID=479676 RepID=A0AAV6JZ59_9ERIC|nr:hypothetical protein RHGRI_017811 [Rhododendron griersonianum]
MSLRHISRVCLRAVQGLKDHNSKTMIKPPQAKPRSESDHPTHPRKFSGVIEPQMMMGDGVDKRRLRQAEKADQLFHLIYWGPN